jgi:hypothetical protein
MAPEKRVDPDDGSAYTWEELSAYYKGKYKKKEIDAYWETCKPAKGKKGKKEPEPKAKAKSKSKEKAKAKAKTKDVPKAKAKVKAKAKPKPKAPAKQFKVCVCGGSGGIGQPLSMLMAMDSNVKELCVFDLSVAMVPRAGVAA